MRLFIPLRFIQSDTSECEDMDDSAQVTVANRKMHNSAHLISILKRLVIVTIPEISLDQCNTLLLKASSETLHSASLHSE